MTDRWPFADDPSFAVITLKRILDGSSAVREKPADPWLVGQLERADPEICGPSEAPG